MGKVTKIGDHLLNPGMKVRDFRIVASALGIKISTTGKNDLMFSYPGIAPCTISQGSQRKDIGKTAIGWLKRAIQEEPSDKMKTVVPLRSYSPYTIKGQCALCLKYSSGPITGAEARQILPQCVAQHNKEHNDNVVPKDVTQTQVQNTFIHLRGDGTCATDNSGPVRLYSQAGPFVVEHSTAEQARSIERAKQMRKAKRDIGLKAPIAEHPQKEKTNTEAAPKIDQPQTATTGPEPITEPPSTDAEEAQSADKGAMVAVPEPAGNETAETSAIFALIDSLITDAQALKTKAEEVKTALLQQDNQYGEVRTAMTMLEEVLGKVKSAA